MITISPLQYGKVIMKNLMDPNEHIVQFNYNKYCPKEKDRIAELTATCLFQHTITSMTTFISKTKQ